jgi:hypothetical protein
MVVQYEDIKAWSYTQLAAIAHTLKAISQRIGEPLVIECQSKYPNWQPSFSIMESSDKVILDGKVIKDRYGNIDKEVKIENTNS